MRLTGARVARSATSAERIDLEIRRGRLQPAEGSGPRLDLEGHLILPGLINSHDHLEFNLFPRLGRGPYPNASAWAEDIYHPERSPVREQLAVPNSVRMLWGGLKNLFSGVTTVAHHNPYDADTFERGFPVRVVKRLGWAHSLRFSPDLAKSFRTFPRAWPFLIHAAEGTDANAAGEIQELERMGVLRRRTVLIHGVGIDCDSLKLLLRRRASVVWCPSSNLFMLSQTLRSEVLHSGIPIALGTDSALTCQNDLAREVQVAREGRCMTPEEIYPMVTTQAARVLRLSKGEGEIRAQGIADLLVVPDSGQNPAEALQQFCPALVIVGGKIKLVSVSFASRIDPMLTCHFEKVELEGWGTFLVNMAVSHLHASTEAFLGPGFRLAGRQVRV